VANLKEISPTIYFNVPRGFDLLLPFLEKDAVLRANFFRRLDLMLYAGAALPQNLWDRMQRLALAERGTRLPLISAWGSTETAPLATGVHYAVDRAGIIGLPVPGCTLKLVPAAKLEARVEAEHPPATMDATTSRSSVRQEGYYRIGPLRLSIRKTRAGPRLRRAHRRGLCFHRYRCMSARPAELIAAAIRHPGCRSPATSGTKFARSCLKARQ
jgi:acyl-CoA synthetase (AMP-forming)/AMP-acid ligase II